MSKTLKQELAEVLNRHSVENASDTPDFVLAEYLMDCLGVWETAVSRRDKWYGFSASTPENVDSPPPGKHRRPPTLAMELAGEAPCPDCWTPENVEEPT